MNRETDWIEHNVHLAAKAIARIILRLTTTGRLAKALAQVVLCMLEHRARIGGTMRGKPERLTKALAHLEDIDHTWRDGDTHEALAALGRAVDLSKGSFVVDESSGWTVHTLDEPGSLQDVLESRKRERTMAEESGLLDYAEGDLAGTERAEKAIQVEAHLVAAEQAIERREAGRSGKGDPVTHALRAMLRAVRILAPLVLVALLGACRGEPTSGASRAEFEERQAAQNRCTLLGIVRNRDVYLCEGAGLRCGVMAQGEGVAISCVDSTPKEKR